MEKSMKIRLSLILLLIFTASATNRAQSNSVEIWMRAFIPNPANAGAASSYILPTPSGSLVRLVPSSSFPIQCFATDHRGFGENASDTSRVETRFVLSLSSTGAGSVVPPSKPSTAAITKELNCSNGSFIRQAPGNIYRDAMGAPAAASGVVQVLGQITATNVLTPLGTLGPSIDYSFDFQWKPSTSTLTTSITVGSFPAFEIYARQPGGTWKAVLKHKPTGPPWLLGVDGMGIQVVRYTDTSVIPRLSGIWESGPPENRFVLEFTGNKVMWSEKNPDGQVLKKESNLTYLVDGTIKIERANTDDVLTHLGFQSALRAEILARGPQNSFMLLTPNADKLTAAWNGLIATKTPAGKLDQLIQPGVRPAKIYQMSQR